MISAAGSPAATSILRHVRSLGHAVVGIDAGAETEPLARAFCDEFYLAPLGNSPAYFDFLLARLPAVDIFMPFVDEELVTIAHQWTHFPAELAEKIAVAEPDVLLDCLDKCRFQAACVAKGLPVAPQAFGPPAFFKPRYGRGGRGVLHLTDQDLFDAVRHRDGVLQRAITGDEYTVDAMYERDGALVAVSPRRRVRAAGVSTVGEVVPDERLHALAHRVGSAWRFRYAINIQVIRDAAGVDWIIEINPRLAGSAIFSTLAGCDPFAATIALWKREPWTAQPRHLRVWRHWQEWAAADVEPRRAD